MRKITEMTEWMSEKEWKKLKKTVFRNNYENGAYNWGSRGLGSSLKKMSEERTR